MPKTAPQTLREKVECLPFVRSTPGAESASVSVVLRQ